MSGLETLPPDQRAVLQLILKQGRGYADLAGLLKIDVGAVRDRALAGIEALGAGAGEHVAPEQRARIADYLLGQQDDAERIVTLAEIAESPAASHWALALHARIAPLAAGPLPEVPGPPSPNGTAEVAAAAPAAAPAAAAVPRRPSRRGGAILLGTGAVLVAVLLIVLLGGGSDSTKSASTPTPPATSASTPASAPATTTSTQPTPDIVARVNLAPTPAGGKATGLGLVGRAGRKLVLALEAQRLPANGAQDIYGVWLEGPPGGKFLGVVGQQVRSNGTFAVSTTLPSDAKRYTTVLVAREPISGAPTQPGQAVLSGGMKLP